MPDSMSPVSPARVLNNSTRVSGWSLATGYLSSTAFCSVPPRVLISTSRTSVLMRILGACCSTAGSAGSSAASGAVDDVSRSLISGRLASMPGSSPGCAGCAACSATAGDGLRPVVLHPGLVRHPDHKSEKGPNQQSLVVHRLAFLRYPFRFTASAPVAFQACEHLPVAGAGRRRLIDHDDVQARQ